MPLLLNRVYGRRTAYQTASTWLGQARHRRQGRAADGRAVRRRGAAGRDRAGARARPKLIFADEPTGSLDSLTGEKVMDLLVGLAREQGTKGHHRHSRRAGGGVRGPGGDGQGRAGLARPGRSRGAGGEARGEGGHLMLGLGLRLALRSGREALVRLAVTDARGRGRGRAAARRAGPSSTPSRRSPASRAGPAPACDPGARRRCPPSGELWSNSVDFYQGQTLDPAGRRRPRRGRAGASPASPRLPAAGQYYASPALAALLRTVPADELGDRFPGTDDRHDRPGGL